MQAGLVNLMHEMTVASGQSHQLPPASSPLAGSDPARPPPHSSTDQRDRALVKSPDSATTANRSSAATGPTSGISDVPRRSMLGRVRARATAAWKGAVAGTGHAAAAEDTPAS
ncbi:MAG: hypothetical protein WDW36_004362 [Sanguina aurantia]